MKKFAALFLFSISVASFGQMKEKKQCSKDSTCCKDVKVNTTIGLGAQIMDFKINNLLESQGLAPLETTMPEFSLGINYFGKKVSVDTELGLLYAKPERNGNETKYISYVARLKAHYNLVNKTKFAFTGGLNLAFSGNQLDVYSQNNIIDLNNLNPNLNTGHISLKNNVFYAGPSVAAYLFKSSKFPVRLNAGYEFALSRGRWDSDFGSVINTVSERGNNRFLFGITLL
ncbi:MAG: hypothetical protein JNJ52_04145 [Flavobacterium sp.]|nr:hypothetical protein [Flavobacterium sp.]